jgi:hypothetical protein
MSLYTKWGGKRTKQWPELNAKNTQNLIQDGRFPVRRELFFPQSMLDELQVELPLSDTKQIC